MKIDSIWGVYNADGGLLGELKYVAGVLFKGNHCSLCDITHKLAWEKKEMAALRETFDIPFKLVHLNEQPKDLALYTEGIAPIVVARTESGYITLVSDEELRGCNGSVQDLSHLISSNMNQKI